MMFMPRRKISRMMIPPPGAFVKCRVGALGPFVDLRGHGGVRRDETVPEPVRRIRGDEAHHPDQQERSGFPQSLREADDRAGQDAGHRERQHMVERSLHFRGADPQCRIADRGRHGLQRGAGGDDDRRQRHQGQHEATDQRGRLRQVRELDEDGEAENTEDDRGNSREIRDIHLDQVGEAVLRREFLEIDRSGDADRQRQHQHHQHHVERAQHRHPDPGLLGAAVRGVRAEDEIEVEAFV